MPSVMALVMGKLLNKAYGTLIWKTKMLQVLEIWIIGIKCWKHFSVQIESAKRETAEVSESKVDISFSAFSLPFRIKVFICYHSI